MNWWKRIDMEKLPSRIKKEYAAFLKHLPCTPGLEGFAVYLKRIADQVFIAGLAEKWLDIHQIYQLSKDAKLKDAAGPIDCIDLKDFFAELFRKRSKVYCGEIEVWAREREIIKEASTIVPIYSFHLNLTILSMIEAYQKYLMMQSARQEEEGDYGPVVGTAQ
jgi:hypothetical protein